MPSNLSITIDDTDFEILKETKSLAIYDVQTQDKQGEFETPDDLIKAATTSLTTQLRKEAQKEGLAPDSYEVEWYLILGKEEDDVNSLVFIEEEDTILSAASEIAQPEVNGSKDFKLYLVGILK